MQESCVHTRRSAGDGFGSSCQVEDTCKKKGPKTLSQMNDSFRGDDLSDDILRMITLEGITAISDEYGFRPDVTEQFLMDYVVHQRVTGGVRCVTKGGMCMPFYQAGGDIAAVERGR